jgi:hypothetical protein
LLNFNLVFLFFLEKGQNGNDSSTSSGEDSSKDFAEHYFQYWNDNLDRSRTQVPVALG